MTTLRAPTGAERAKDRLYVLELGRFIAAFAVFIGHLALFINQHAAAPGQQIFAGVMFPAALGVQYFFVLSGFVMLHAHHGDFGKLGAVPRFWWRRICRIYPLYWLALAIPIGQLGYGSSAAAVFHIISLEPGLLGPHYVQEHILPAWSLRYEIAFYIMFGLCLLPYIGRPLLACWVFLCLWRWSGPAIHLFHPQFMMDIYRFSLGAGGKFIGFFEYYFFAGLAAAALYRGNFLRRGMALALLASACIVLLLMLPGEMWGLNYGLPLFSLGFACAVAGIILGLAALELHGVISLGRYAKWAGAMSYPLYILHGPLIALVETGLPWGRADAPVLYLHFAAETFLMLLISALAAFLFDLPVQRGLRRLTAYAAGRLSPHLPLRPLERRLP